VGGVLCALSQVYFTQDGKEYVTPQQLESEIRDELMQHGGKVGVLNLPTLLNIDLNHIEARLAEMLKRDKRLQIMNGEVMTKYTFPFDRYVTCSALTAVDCACACACGDWTGTTSMVWRKRSMKLWQNQARSFSRSSHLASASPRTLSCR
jgi:hypothetical protein